MTKINIKIASQRGLLTLEASILMTVFAIAAMGFGILLAAYLPSATQVWMTTTAAAMCSSQNGVLHRRYPNCGGNGSGPGHNNPCCRIRRNVN